MEKKQKNIGDILPHDLIHRILLRVPAKHLARLRCISKLWLPCKFHLYGFGYDASQDDYLVVVAWHDKDYHYHLDYLSLRTNSWINLDAALTKPLGVFEINYCGLFLNGAIHWLPHSPKTYRGAILIFDLKERTLSKISGPEQPVMSAFSYSNLALLGGCLALY
ncbi:F-box/kelch-repeat protein At3g23880-like [Arachis duranensis]|uniref:F-box/kelch-repeat protein At3g23880-like n=1 Tax=Arachis duranensis TaxID=130453 RepID=A0A9C6TN41_ARADU|nr:F-box/kelch-repeat protein At3g23880-like [Arachis duranensis]